MTTLRVGDTAPDFTSVTQDGQPFTKADLMGQRTILYFYPKDNTSGCTLEAKSLRDGKAELAAMGFRIVGVSPDSERSHRNFCAKHELNFTLLADTDHSVCEAFGVWAEKSMYGRKYMGVLRTTFRHRRRGGASKRFSPRWTPRITIGRSPMLTNKQNNNERYGRKTQANADKLKVLSAVMDKIEKDFGKGSIMRMNSSEIVDVPVIPTGSITLDMALGVGGYPKGRVIEIYGPRIVGQDDAGDPCDRRGAEGGRHRSLHRRRARVRQFLRTETRRGRRQPAHLAARQRRAGTRNRRLADPFERDRHHRHRLGGGTHPPRPRSKATWATRKWACKRGSCRRRCRKLTASISKTKDRLHLHQPAARQDRRGLRQSRNHDRRQRAEILCQRAYRHPPHVGHQGRRGSSSEPAPKSRS